MKPNRALFAVLVPVTLFTLGCSEDVGSCEDPLQGKTTALFQDQIQYGGQAIMNSSCANGICHSSQVSGAARNGAPQGLDFDVFPIAESEGEGDATTKTMHTIVKLKDEDVKGLRERQRNIFEKRNLIWTQVKEGLMPPDGMFDQFKQLIRIKGTDEKSPCIAKGNGYMDITTKPSQDILRNWLACNTPIVESAGVNVDENGVAGQAGYQFISCEAPPDTTPVGDGGVPINDGGGLGGMDGGTDAGGGGVASVTLTQLQEKVFDNYCAVCHPAVNDTVDLTSVDKSFAAFVTDMDEKCDGKPYVTPGDPSKSFLVDLVSKANPGCGKMRMPQGAPLSAANQKLISDWIASGAKK
jgi:cytochrome c5